MSEHDESAWVENSELLTRRFGYWPSFHDAELRRWEMLPVSMIPGEEDFCDLTLRLKMFLFDYSEPDAAGFLHRKKPTLVTLAFHGVGRLALESYGSQPYSIDELSIRKETRDDGPSPFLSVVLEKFPWGFGASYECYRVELISVEDADLHGRPIS